MSEPLFRLQGIGFAYDPSRPVLDDVSLAIGWGERLALAGPNGAGKTTLLHLLVGLRKPARGRLFAFGRERREERDFREVRARAGLLFQDPDDQLFCPTVLEDVAFGPLNLGRSRAEARRLSLTTLEDLQIGHLAERVTHHLSGGEKRLVTLATVLAMQPDALLLDEPTTGLDEAAQARLCEALLALPQAMLIVSHDRAFRQRLATRTVTLSGGRIAEAGPSGHHRSTTCL